MELVVVEGAVFCVLTGLPLVDGDCGEDDGGDVCRGLGDCSLFGCCCFAVEVMDRVDGGCDNLVGVIGGGRLGGTGL